jgi:hypothetical protein
MFNELHSWIQRGGSAPLLVLAGWLMLAAINIGLAIVVSLSGQV